MRSFFFSKLKYVSINLSFSKPLNKNTVEKRFRSAKQKTQFGKAGGPVLVELFLDLCCPFSKRMLHTVAGFPSELDQFCMLFLGRFGDGLFFLKKKRIEFVPFFWGWLHDRCWPGGVAASYEGKAGVLGVSVRIVVSFNSLCFPKGWSEQHVSLLYQSCFILFHHVSIMFHLVSHGFLMVFGGQLHLPLCGATMACTKQLYACCLSLRQFFRGIALLLQIRSC